VVEDADELGQLVEVGIGFAGFSGMVIAIRSRWATHPWDTFHAATLLLSGFNILFLALLPSALHAFAITGSNL